MTGELEEGLTNSEDNKEQREAAESGEIVTLRARHWWNRIPVHKKRNRDTEKRREGKNKQ